MAPPRSPIHQTPVFPPKFPAERQRRAPHSARRRRCAASCAAALGIFGIAALLSVSAILPSRADDGSANPPAITPPAPSAAAPTPAKTDSAPATSGKKRSASDDSDKLKPPRTITATKWTMPSSVASRTPDLFAPVPVYKSPVSIFLRDETDVRYRNLTQNSFSISRTNGSYVAASRLTAEYIRAASDTGEERGGARLQALLETERPGGTVLTHVRPSEAYVFYRFEYPGVSATVRAGQFVLPFGLIAVYDTPLQPIQPLYELALGLRVDTGVMLEGVYGPYHYMSAITTGAGPNRTDPDSNKVVSFRLSRTLDTKLGLFQVGGSLLTGRLPKTGFETVLLPSGTLVPQLVAGPSGINIEEQIAYVNKTRFAGDGEYALGNLTAKGEFIFGGDDDSQTQASVWGYFAEGDYRLRPRLSLVAYTRSWNFPIKPQEATTLGAGLNFDLGNGFVLRSLFEFERDVPPLDPSEPHNPTVVRRLTLQTRVAF